MPTRCSSAPRMDREVDSVELVLMLPTNSAELKPTLLGVLAPSLSLIPSTSMTFDGDARGGGGREEVRGVRDVVP